MAEGMDDTLQRWQEIRRTLESTIAGAGDARLDHRRTPASMTVRETVHHIVEANLVASTIAIAALARPGTVYDWSWLMPGGSWMQNIGYGRLPLATSLDLLRAVASHLAAVLAAIPDALDRQIQLRDAPGADTYSKSVRDILHDEVEHAASHLADLGMR